MIQSSNFDDIFKRNISVGKVELFPVHTLDGASEGFVSAASAVPFTVDIGARGEVLYLYGRLVLPRNSTVVGQ